MPVMSMRDAPSLGELAAMTSVCRVVRPLLVLAYVRFSPGLWRSHSEWESSSSADFASLSPFSRVVLDLGVGSRTGRALKVTLTSPRLRFDGTNLMNLPTARPTGSETRHQTSAPTANHTIKGPSSIAS
jgi:hypothetical protein